MQTKKIYKKKTTKQRKKKEKNERKLKILLEIEGFG